MERLKGDSLEDFLDLALRHEVIESYRLCDRSATIVVDGAEHRLDHHQVWSWLSTMIYDRLRDVALGDADPR